MKRISFLGVLALSSSIFMVSCDKARVYEDNLEFKGRSWVVSQPARFDFTIADTTIRYAIYYNVRNSLDYPFARIFVTWHLLDSAGGDISKQLVYNELFHEKTGKPFGESGLGDLFDHQFLLLKHHRFPAPGRYSVQLDQFMRKDTLTGVIAVGVRVEREESAQNP